MQLALELAEAAPPPLPAGICHGCGAGGELIQAGKFTLCPACDKRLWDYCAGAARALSRLYAEQGESISTISAPHAQ